MEIDRESPLESLKCRKYNASVNQFKANLLGYLSYITSREIDIEDESPCLRF